MTPAQLQKLMQTASPATAAEIGRKLGTQPRQKQRRGRSPLEQKWERIWAEIGGPALEREAKLIPGRKFAFDFCYRPAKVALEVHGATFTNGGHVRGKAFARDRGKMAAAQELGWLVYELTAKELTHDWARRVLRTIRSRDATAIGADGR